MSRKGQNKRNGMIVDDRRLRIPKLSKELPYREYLNFQVGK